MYLVSKPHGKGYFEIFQSFLCSVRLKILGQVEGKPLVSIKIQEKYDQN